MSLNIEAILKSSTDSIDVERICRDLHLSSVHFRPGFLSSDLRHRLLWATEALCFETLPSVVGKHRVRQEIRLAKCVSDDGLVSKFSAGFSSLLIRAICQYFGDKSPFDGELTLSPDVIEYPVGSLGISIHRDPQRHLICLLSLEGVAKLTIYRNRRGDGPVEFNCQPGDLLILPGPGFMGLKHGPFHSVSDVQGKRTILSLKGPSPSTLTGG